MTAENRLTSKLLLLIVEQFIDLEIDGEERPELLTIKQTANELKLAMLQS